jgi:hypothetical protein
VQAGARHADDPRNLRAPLAEFPPHATLPAKGDLRMDVFNFIIDLIRTIIELILSFF